MRVCIDAGHGGSELGAVRKDVCFEKDINNKVCFKLWLKLQTTFGIEVVQTRHSMMDNDISLADRVKIANDSKADLFISIHHNANDGKTKQAEVYCSVIGGKGKEFADILSNEYSQVKTSKVIQRQGNDGDYYYVIKHTNMPAVISEFAYIDSVDYYTIDTDEKIEAEAQMIYVAILKYFNLYQTVEPVSQHFAEDSYQNLCKHITIHEKRFDDKITRGETFVLLNQLLKLIKEFDV